MAESAEYGPYDGDEGYETFDDRLLEAEEAPSPGVAQAATRGMAGGFATVRNDAGPVDAPLVSDSDTTATEQPPVQERLRVFSADLQLSVASVSSAREQIIDSVEEGGGYIESSSENYLVVRVPAAQFEHSLDLIEQLGDVLARSVSTADVTEQFLDMERRLEIATVSRDRLYQLLERAEDSDERVSILREIRRLTEEIERLRTSLDSLSRLVQYSRISIQLIARIQTAQATLLRIPFAWIASLNPLYATLGAASSPIEVAVPDAFALFSEGERIHGESADGVRLRIGARENRPTGDAEFWQEAIRYHLGPLYRVPESVEIGEFRGVRLESKDVDPFVYMIAVMVREDELIVAEVFYPDLDAEDAHSSSLTEALEETR